MAESRATRGQRFADEPRNRTNHLLLLPSSRLQLCLNLAHCSALALMLPVVTLLAQGTGSDLAGVGTLGKVSYFFRGCTGTMFRFMLPQLEAESPFETRLFVFAIPGVFIHFFTSTCLVWKISSFES